MMYEHITKISLVLLALRPPLSLTVGPAAVLGLGSLG